MAIATGSHHDVQESDHHDVWHHAFSDETRRELAHDDHIAGLSVFVILISIAAMGLMFAIIALIATAS